MAKQLVYYKRNVPYTVVVRRSVMDAMGYSLNNSNPVIALEEESLRDFKIANKRAILDGLIVPTEEPQVDWETPNALTDEDATELLKNYLKLKNTLTTIDSASTLYKLLEAAKTQDKSDKIKKLIRDRLEEVTGEEILSPAEMQGVTSN